MARVLAEKARSNANRARLVEPLSPAEIGDEAFAHDVQQAAEKYLKAVIAWRGWSYPFTHDLGKLIEVAEKAGIRLPIFDRDVAESLTAFAAAERYETVRATPALDRAALMAVLTALETWARKIVR